MFFYLIAFYGTRRLDGTSKQQEFFGKRCFTRIRVRDDGKGSSSSVFRYDTSCPYPLKGNFDYVYINFSFWGAKLSISNRRKKFKPCSHGKFNFFVRPVSVH